MKQTIQQGLFAIALTFSAASMAQGIENAPPCSPQIPEGQICYVENLNDIHAAQFNYGREYVTGWAFTHLKLGPSDYQLELDKIFFPVVISPDQKIYLEDGHHRLMASQEIANQEQHTYRYYLKVTKRFEPSTNPQAMQQFWAWMDQSHNVWLKDLGMNKTPEQLPSNITQLSNDKYRTLAGWLMEAKWCYNARMENSTNYIEFYWADYFRALAKQHKIEEYPDPIPISPEGLQAKVDYLNYIKHTGLCHAPTASKLPGYCSKDEGCSG